MSRRAEVINDYPEELIVFHNEDKKKFKETWHPGRSLLDFPHPSRICIFGQPSSGKSSLIKNIVVRVQASDRPFEKFVVIHPSVSTQEYDWLVEGVDPEELEDDDPPFVMRNTLPTITEWEDIVSADEEGHRPKTCVILDDFSYENMKKKDHESLSLLMRHISTHMSCTVMVTSQNFILLPLIIRRQCQVFCIFQPGDARNLASLAQTLLIAKSKLERFFRELDTYDFLVVDKTPKSPAKYRLNGFQIIDSSNLEK